MTFVEEIKAERVRDRAVEAAAIGAAQNACAHTTVYHWSGEYGGGSITFPVRVCMDCGLEEEGSWWSYSGNPWSAKEFTPAILGAAPGRTFIQVNHTRFSEIKL